MTEQAMIERQPSSVGTTYRFTSEYQCQWQDMASVAQV